jgi:hypothetical protein
MHTVHTMRLAIPIGLAHTKDGERWSWRCSHCPASGMPQPSREIAQAGVERHAFAHAPAD